MRSRGFTLLEVLVGLTIAALALGALSAAGLTGLGISHTTERYEQATALARSRLAMAIHTDPLVAGDWQGNDVGYSWHVHIAPLESTTIRPINTLTQRGSSMFPLTLYAVSVAITWPGSTAYREVRLETQRIGQDAR